jgi:hypothetical protein
MYIKELWKFGPLQAFVSVLWIYFIEVIFCTVLSMQPLAAVDNQTDSQHSLAHHYAINVKCLCLVFFSVK